MVRHDGTEQTLHTAWSFQTERRPGEGKQQLLGFQWQAEEGRLTWRVGDYELEWLFYEQQDSQTKGGSV